MTQNTKQLSRRGFLGLLPALVAAPAVVVAKEEPRIEAETTEAETIILCNPLKVDVAQVKRAYGPNALVMPLKNASRLDLPIMGYKVKGQEWPK